MKVLRVLFLILGLAIVATAQKSILTGSVYDAYGALIIGAKITAINEKGEKFEALTNNDGIYILNLPYNPYRPEIVDFKIAKYEIIVEKENFEKTIIKNFKFAPSYKGKVNLDFAMDVFVNINTITVQTNEVSEKKLKKNKSNYCGTIRDEFGAVIPSAEVEGKSSNGKKFKTSTNENGEFEIEVIDGIYNILIKAESYKKAVLKNQKLPLELQNCVEIKLKSNVPPHQIT